MARQVTLLTLLSDLAECCDDPPYSDSPATFVTKAAATRYLSQSCHAFALQHRGFGILSASTTFNTVSGTTSYAVPSDFAALEYMVYLYQGENQPMFRRVIEDIDLAPRQNASAWGVSDAIYALEGEFFVTNDPKDVFTVTVRYVPELPMRNAGGTPIPDFSADTDVLLCKSGIDQWVVWDAAIKVKRKQDQDPSMFVAARGDIEEVLKASLVDRDTLHAPTVSNAWDRARRTNRDNQRW